MLGLVLVSLVLRTLSLGDSLWMDEGLSIGISSQPFLDIPTVLRQDGSPPLYYMLLNLWTSVIGSGPGETQGLSVVISLLLIPAALWAGWTLFDRRAGLIAAALAAVNPFVTTYAQETRMYSLMVLLSLIVTAAFVHVFVFRRRQYLPLLAVSLAALLYTHNWGMFVASGLVVALAFLWRTSDGAQAGRPGRSAGRALVGRAPDRSVSGEHRSPVFLSDERRDLLRDAAIGFGAAALLYLPWLPTLLYQVRHTGAPWLDAPRLGAPVQIAKSLLGGGASTVALVLAAGSGLALALRERLSRERSALFTMGIVFVGTLAVAWLVSQVSPAWTTRYLGATLGALLLLASVGLARAGNLGLVALAIVLGVWAVPKSYELKNKSNAADLGKTATPQLRSGDLVVVMQPEQTPLIDYHLPVGGLRYATPLGPVRNPSVMDWTDAQSRLVAATPRRNLDPQLASLPRGAKVFFVHPVTTQQNDWDAPWTQLVRRRSAQWGLKMGLDPRFRQLQAAPDFYRRATRIGVRGVLYEKRS
ncbi:MAG: glycosyltransferase family 39 protein [Actinomycetota bacterium]|nr:glycosyltransferase family 39 protein [Actinomycetota bacterium]